MRIEIEINGKVRDVTVEPDAARPGRVQVSWTGRRTRSMHAS